MNTVHKKKFQNFFFLIKSNQMKQNSRKKNRILENKIFDVDYNLIC